MEVPVADLRSVYAPLTFPVVAVFALLATAQSQEGA
jgi:hypothetical protein